jgi:hypothetical protein
MTLDHDPGASRYPAVPPSAASRSPDSNAALAALSPTTNDYPPTSRYAGVPTVQMELPRQGEIVYLGRRFVPPGTRFAEIGRHVVEEGERLDQVATAALGDPEQSWRLCDANEALYPAELEEPGGSLRITMPEGIPGAPDAR